MRILKLFILRLTRNELAILYQAIKTYKPANKPEADVVIAMVKKIEQVMS